MSRQLRMQVLRILSERYRKDPSRAVDDAEIAEVLQLPVEEIQRQLDMLAVQEVIELETGYGQYCAFIAPKGMLLLEEVEEALAEPSARPIGFGAPEGK